MSLVLDSSVALGWIYRDETSPDSSSIRAQVVGHGAIAPGIWPLEIANSLHWSVQRRRIDEDFRDQSLADLAQLDIAIDSETHVFAWTATLALADRFRLTLYDACYLELAQRRRVPLATLDTALRAACRGLGVPVAP